MVDFNISALLIPWYLQVHSSRQPQVSKVKMTSRSPSPEFSPLSMGEDLTPLPAYKAATTTSIDFDSLLSPPLLLHEDLKSGCGGQLWPAGMVLSRQMLRYHRDDLKTARMWECLIFLICDGETDKLVSNLVQEEVWWGWRSRLDVQ